MCGIIAQMNVAQPVNQMEFNAARDLMFHRGPDGAGSDFLDDGRVALGHRRLSIIDLTAAGKQPMSNEAQSIWLTFNGEIYNYRSLRRLLEAKGHQFSSNTDSEVLIHGYAEWGVDLVDQLKGMFAFAIWDDIKKVMFIGRDHFGVKPVCFYHDDTTFIVASELKAITALSTVRPELDFRSVADFFTLRYIPSPQSIWKNVKKLKPGHCMSFDVDGKLKEWCYWKPQFQRNSIAPKHAKEHLHDLLSTSIQENFISDAPVGLLLSGGIDSATIAAYATKQKQNLSTYCLGFEGWEGSEHLDARVVADSLNTVHHELMVKDEFSDLVDKLTYFFDEPLGGTAFLPTYLVSKLASENVKVVLGGHGGDEVFAGYAWHSRMYQQWNWSLRGKLRRLSLGNQGYLVEATFQARSWTKWRYSQLKKLVSDEIYAEFDDRDYHVHFDPFFMKGFGPIKNAQSLDLSLFLPELNLSFYDKASMANSIEGRVPLLDHKLVEFVLSLHESTYFKRSHNKYLLKELLAGHVPESILNKPKKGFGFKIKRFISLSQMESEIRDSRCYAESRIFRKKFLEELFQVGHMNGIWAVFLFCKWYDRWC
ncbi:MAG: asparagine synthase (glutamine-hydrolyzing) [Cytophagales bacterium]|nr:asparagine synthase (glutamine-hydrolyzing) [Cytophagales bacterium]